MSMLRAMRFLRRVFVVIAIIVVIAAALFVVQLAFHPFDTQISAAKSFIDNADSMISTQLFSGISVGMIVLALIVTLLPLLMKNVDNRQYFKSVERGTVAAFVFFGTQLLYRWAGQVSRLYLILAVVGVTLVAYVIVEFLSLITRKDEEVAFRTDILASISSGLLTGIVLTLVSIMFKL